MSNIFISIKRHNKNRKLLKKVTRKITSPFLIKPRNVMHKTGSYSTSHLTKGYDYHSIFVERPGTNMIWNLEKIVISEILSQKDPFNLHLDFAGGTGRIASLLTPYVKNQIVLDISQNMLSVAEKNLPEAIIINRDFRKGLNEVEDGCLDIATAFRFFANAENQLRKDAMAFLSNKLGKGGLLICNNHRNFWSIPYLTQRLTLKGGDVGMANNLFLTIAEHYKFRLIKTFSIGLIPQSENSALLPWKVVIPIERFLLRSIGTKQTCGYNVIFLFEKI